MNEVPGNLATANLLAEARQIESSIIEIRRRLHRCPELQYELHQTSEIVCTELDRLDIEFSPEIAETGVVATIGQDDSRCIMLRADMDALPIQEMADVDFRSQHEGRMHACGHDCHTAMLLGEARILKQRESELKGMVKLCFQPAEEGGAGAKRMCDEGVLENPRVEKAFGIHVWPMLPSGQLTGRPGPFLAATNAFQITVTGCGGHAALPHLAIDPITTAAKIVTAAQTLISREQNPLQPGVVSFTAINGGSAHNVIPEEVMIGGTIRSLSTENRDQIKKRLAEVAKLIATADRCAVEFSSIGVDYPETSNDPELWEQVHAMGLKLVGEGNFPLCEPMLGGEDFAFYGSDIPTCFVALGCHNEDKGCIFGLHHPQFKVDESVLHLGTALHVAFAKEHLG